MAITDPRFLACLPYTLKEEGGFSNDPHDPGGATDRGITQSEYNRWRAHNGEPAQDVRRMSTEEMNEIYYQGYWLPNCPGVPSGLDMQLFDTNVNQGPGRGTKILQEALGVAADGAFGPVTHAAATACDVASTIKKFTAIRQAVYRNTGGFQYFGSDWIGRANRIGAASLKMVGAPRPVPVDAPKPASVTPKPVPPAPPVAPAPRPEAPSLFDLFKRLFKR